MAAGIATFLAIATPTGGTAVPGLAAWGPVFLGAAVLCGLCAMTGLRVEGKARVIWLAVAAGAVYGVLDALAKATVDVLAHHGLGVLATWEPWALLVAGITGALLGQSAFSSGALSLSLPVIGTLAPITAVVIGATVFGEQLASAAWQLGVQLGGGALAVAGIFLLSRSSIVAAETSAPRRAGPGPGRRGGAERDRLRKLIGSGVTIDP